MHKSNIGTINARLGLPGLPNLTDSLVAGGIYLLIAETASARFPVLSASLASGLTTGMNCRLLLPQNPEPLIERLQSFGNLNINQAIREHKLALFTVQDEFSKKMFRYGAEAFVKELEHFAFPDGSYIIFDQADELLALHDVLIALDQVEVLKKWTSAHNITFLLILTRASEAHASTVNALMDNLTGIARLGAKRQGLELSFDYWQSSEGTIAGRSFTLRQLSSGLYEAVNDDDAATQKSVHTEHAPDHAQRIDALETQVFYMDPDLGSLAKQMQGKWQYVDSLVGMMHATRHLSSATCILLFQKDSQLRQLAETVHTLRLTTGRYAHIVVQEKNASLRYQNEALLLKLGLNLVINRDVPVSRLPLLLQSLQGQIFNRDVDINFEAALASVLPTQLHGYLTPPRFVQEVAHILERSETLDVPYALMVGRPAPQISMLDLMAGNQISRPGDLMTADTENCIVFLNACPQPVLLTTLERLLGLSVDLAFASVRFAVSKAEIEAELAALSRAATQELLPDYTGTSPSQAKLATHELNPGASKVRFSPQQPLKSPTPEAASLLLAKPVLQSPVRVAVISQVQAMSTDEGTLLTPPYTALDFDAEELLFDYEGDSDAWVFRKDDAPRATRAASNK